MKNNVIKTMKDNIFKFLDFVRNLNTEKPAQIKTDIVKEKLGSNPVPKEIPAFEKTLKRTKIIIEYYKEKHPNLWSDMIADMYKKGLNPKKMTDIDIILWYLDENKELEVGKIKMSDEDKDNLKKILNNAKKVIKYYQEQKEEIWNATQRNMIIKGLEPNNMSDVDILLWYFDYRQKHKFFA